MPPSKDPLARLAGRVDWIELVTGFACNCNCRVCSSGLHAGSAPLDERDMAAWLARGRDLGATGVWLGGGEPTLHEGLLRTVGHARSLGYRRVRVQTNGLRLAYQAYVASLERAGATEVALSVKGWDAGSHDAMVRRTGAWDLLARAFDNLRVSAVRLEADVLLTTPLLPHLADLVQEIARRGAENLTFWLMSLHGLPDDDALTRLVPPLGGLRAPLRKAFAQAQACGLAATSLHTPPCALAPDDRDRYLHAGRYRLLVVVPGSPPFMAESSPMERGEHPPDPCRGCAARKGCLGLRTDQIRLHGTRKLTPVPLHRGAVRRRAPHRPPDPRGTSRQSREVPCARPRRPAPSRVR